MKNVWKWVLLGAGVFLIGFVVALPFFVGPNLGGMRIGGRMMGYSFPWWNSAPWLFGGWMLLTRCLFPLGVLGLLVAGVIALFRSSAKSQSQTVRTCSHCGKPLQPDWLHCPYCGEKN